MQNHAIDISFKSFFRYICTS